MSSKQVAEKLDRLAKVLLEEALAAQPPAGAPSRLDVFKAVVQYHVGSTRAEKGSRDPDSEGASFSDIKSMIAFGDAKPEGSA
jgi:hypothetical protein